MCAGVQMSAVGSGRAFVVTAACWHMGLWLSLSRSWSGLVWTGFGVLPYVVILGAAEWLGRRSVVLLGSVLLSSDVYVVVVVLQGQSSTAPIAIVLQRLFACALVAVVLVTRWIARRWRRYR